MTFIGEHKKCRKCEYCKELRFVESDGVVEDDSLFYSDSNHQSMSGIHLYAYYSTAEASIRQSNLVIENAVSFDAGIDVSK